MDDHRPTIVDYLYIWLKWRRVIFSMVVIASLLALVVSLVLPIIYMATATVLPPKEDSTLGFSSSLESITSRLNVLGLGESEELDTYTAILQSRRVRETVIREFGLLDYFEKETMDEALKALDPLVDIEITKENSLMLTVFHRDSIKVAEIANFFIAEMDRINKALSNDQARSNRTFVERRLEQNRDDLRDAEERLRAYQVDNSTLGLSEENRSALLAGAELEAHIMALEVQRDVMSKSFGAAHPMLALMKTEIDASKGRLAELPEIGLDMARLFREVEIQTRLLAFLLPQYEQAKIQEVRDTPTVQVIDPAVPPQLKYSPKRLFIVLGAFFSSLLIALVITLNLETIQQARASGTPRGRRIDLVLLELRALLSRGR